MEVYFAVIIVILAALIIGGIILKTGGVNFRKLKDNYKYAFFFLIVEFVLMIIINNLPDVKNIIISSSLEYRFLEEYSVFFASTGINILITSVVMVIHKIIIESVYIAREESKYQVEELPYYRDLIGDISPAMLLYIYNSSINYEDMVIGTLLYLEEKEIIKINDNGVVNILRDLNSIRPHERCIVEYATNKLNYEEFKKKFKKVLLEDLKNEGFLEDKTLSFSFLELLMLFCLWIFLTLIVSMSFLSIAKLGFLTYITYFVVFIDMIIINLIYNKSTVLFRTSQNLILNSKLGGLKRFLSHFSVLKDEKIESIKLYRDYTLYTIIFDIKGELNDEVKDLYKKIISNFQNKEGFVSLSNVSKESKVAYPLIIFFMIFMFVFFLLILMTPGAEEAALAFGVLFILVFICFILKIIQDLKGKK